MGDHARSREIAGALGRHWARVSDLGGSLRCARVERAGGADSNAVFLGPWSRVWALVWIGSPSKLKSSMYLRNLGNSRTVPFLVRVWEGKGVTAADLVGLRSPRALWDRNMHDSSRGGAEFRQFKLRHQPWALTLLGLGAVRELPRFLRPPQERVRVGK